MILKKKLIIKKVNNMEFLLGFIIGGLTGLFLMGLIRVGKRGE